jgi:prolyl 4-hydroxylase
VLWVLLYAAATAVAAAAAAAAAAGAAKEVTDFASCEEHEFKYKPRLGDAVLFYSLDPDLTINPRSLHGGCAVTRGEKWVATKWIHEKPV